jgi:hypothetical protein
MIQTSLCSAFPGVEIKGPANPVQVGSQVEVVCNGSGTPPPEVMWLKDGAPLGNSSLLVTPSNLRLSDVRSGDEGNYTCVVSNILGNNSASFMLVVGEYHMISGSENIIVCILFLHIENTLSWIPVVIPVVVVAVVVVLVVLVVVMVKGVVVMVKFHHSSVMV